MRRWGWLATGLAFPLLILSCAPGKAGLSPDTDLAPAVSARKAPALEMAAVDSAAGVKITVQADAWPGDARIEEAVQPLRVILENRSGRPVLITYDKFTLLGPLGRRFSALSPYNIQGTLENPEVKMGNDPIPDPMIIVERFELVPEYGPLYPGTPVTTGVLYTDTVYRDRFVHALADTALPSPTMLKRALPEGALRDGGRLDGYLYFEKVPADIVGVSFRAQLVDVSEGRVIGTLAVPFRVIREEPGSADDFIEEDGYIEGDDYIEKG